jgi:dolichyl-phosphate beta-glucosyltransferase
MSIELSLVLPAFNEAARLPPYLREIRTYFSGPACGDYEVIVVDDGSSDGMSHAILTHVGEWSELRLLRHDSNRGKGAAVRTGMAAARGELILFADSDGATPIAEERRLRAAIRDGADLAIGSRLIPAPGLARSRRWYREIGSRLFAVVSHSVLHISARDTQCGFKMFRREFVGRLFGSCREDGYLFDLHVLALSERLGLMTAEVGVAWSEIRGSKIRPAADPWLMVAGLHRVRRGVAEAARSVASREFSEPTDRGGSRVLASYPEAPTWLATSGTPSTRASLPLTSPHGRD